RAATPISSVAGLRRSGNPRATKAYHRPSPPVPDAPPEVLVAEASEPAETVEPPAPSTAPPRPVPLPRSSTAHAVATPAKMEVVAPPPRREPFRRFEIAATALWSFPVDGPPSGPVGEMEIGVRWSRLGVSVRGGVAQDWSATAASPGGPVSLSA